MDNAQKVEQYPLWDSEWGSVGNWFTGPTNLQFSELLSLSLSLSRSLSLPLYIKSHWSLTKERIQIRSTKTPLWGASERLNEHWYTFAHSVLLPWPQLHCRETTQGEKDAARSEKKLKQCKNPDEDERSVFPLYPPHPSGPQVITAENFYKKSPEHPRAWAPHSLLHAKVGSTDGQHLWLI